MLIEIHVSINWSPISPWNASWRRIFPTTHYSIDAVKRKPRTRHYLATMENTATAWSRASRHCESFPDPRARVLCNALDANGPHPRALNCTSARCARSRLAAKIAPRISTIQADVATYRRFWNLPSQTLCNFPHILRRNNYSVLIALFLEHVLIVDTWGALVALADATITGAGLLFGQSRMRHPKAALQSRDRVRTNRALPRGRGVGGLASEIREWER